MRLEELMPGVPPAAREVEVSGLAYDNRAVTPGTLFFCVPGFTRDGHAFAADAIHFALAIFTNLTQDHLDFHPTMEDYFHAKRRLFAELLPRHSVINLDDHYGALLASELGAPITFALEQDATYRAVDLRTGI